jgi:hypothetical protein
MDQLAVAETNHESRPEIAPLGLRELWGESGWADDEDDLAQPLRATGRIRLDPVA